MVSKRRPDLNIGVPSIIIHVPFHPRGPVGSVPISNKTMAIRVFKTDTPRVRHQKATMGLAHVAPDTPEQRELFNILMSAILEGGCENTSEPDAK